MGGWKTGHAMSSWDTTAVTGHENSAHTQNAELSHYKLQRVSLPLKSSCSVKPHVKSKAFAEVPGEPLNKSMANVLASIKKRNILNTATQGGSTNQESRFVTAMEDGQHGGITHAPRSQKKAAVS